MVHKKEINYRYVIVVIRKKSPFSCDCVEQFPPFDVDPANFRFHANFGVRIGQQTLKVLIQDEHSLEPVGLLCKAFLLELFSTIFDGTKERVNL